MGVEDGQPTVISIFEPGFPGVSFSREIRIYSGVLIVPKNGGEMEERILYTPVSTIIKNMLGSKAAKYPGKPSGKMATSDSFETSGPIKQLGNSFVIIEDRKILLGDETWIIGHLRNDAYVVVKGVIQDDDSLFAKKIVVRTDA